jgi:hypothetical protein
MDHIHPSLRELARRGTVMRISNNKRREGICSGGPEMSKAPKEYHLISLVDGQSYGGFISITGAREYAREEKYRELGNLSREQIG